MPNVRACFLPAMLGLGLATAAVPVTAALPTPIRNVATLTYGASSGAKTILSNTVTIQGQTQQIVKKPTSFTFKRLPSNYAFPGISCDTSNGVVFTPGEITPEQVAAGDTLNSLDIRNPVMFVLQAPGANRDPLVREMADIDVTTNGYTGKVRLMETAPDSSVFAGGVPAVHDASQSGTVSACDLPLIRKGSLKLTYTEDGFSFGSSFSLLIDPTGYVFDSKTGEAINGATVTIIDDATGQPAAKVFSDDGDTYPNTVVTGQNVTDGGGDIITVTKGNFRFPLLPVGNYHLKVVPPAGYTAPSVVTRDKLTALSGPEGAYIIADSSYGASFALIDPQPLQVDIPIDGAAGTALLLLDKTTSTTEASPGDFIQYDVQLTNRGTAAAGAVAIVDRLPVGLRYKAGSAHGVSFKLAEPLVSGNGRTLTFTVPALAVAASLQVTYVVEVTPGAPIGEAINHATATGAAGLASNDASASVRLKPLLNTDALTLLGRVTEGDCHLPDSHRKGVPGIRLILEDGTYIVTDRDGMYHIEGVRAGTHVVQLDTRSIPPMFEPVACDSDTRQAHSTISRFVEGGGGSLQRVDFQLRRTGKSAKADVLLTEASDDAAAAGNRPDWLAAAAPGIDWMFPLVDHNPRSPALRIVIRHKPGQRVALTVNGTVNDPLSYDGTDADDARGVAISRWTGLPLIDGDNILVARVLNEDGSVAQTLNRTVHYANVPASVVYVPEKSRLIADGLTKPLIAVRVLDREGHPVRAGTTVPFRVDAPYTAALAVEMEQGRQLAGLERTQATAHVTGDEGIAFIALTPTTQAGSVHATVTLRKDQNDKVGQVSDIKAWLEAGTQDWVIVGFGKGTLGFDTLSSRAQPIQPSKTDLVKDGQIAFYAKGRIKGSWIATIAYDSAKQYDRDRGLLGVIDPDRYYTVYGDGSAQTYDAATRKKLYLRLERRDAYALFGDFETGMTDTKLARYSRTLNGLKAEYHGRTLSFKAFAANDDQLYGRDEIQGNGLSGPYRLSASQIVANSDQISIETRDRYRSEKIIDTKQLTRHIDYDIDAAAGTIRFRDPVLSRDSNQNPIFIVVDYETYGTSRKKIAGGRGAAKLLHGRMEVGASLLHDETVGNASVAALDLKAHPVKNTEIRVEAATGGTQGLSKGRAMLVEAEHHDGRLDVLAYVHRQESSFGLSQQNFGEAGTAKYGFDGRLRVNEKLTVTGTAWYQNDLDSDARRLAGDVRVEYRAARGIVFAGAQVASDHTDEGQSRDSRLLSLGATQTFFENRLQVTAQTQFAIGGANASVDFPVRHLVEASYRLKPGIRLIASEEIARGAQFTAHSTRAGVDLSPFAGTHLMTTLNQQAIGENGPRTFAEYGLNQSVPLGKHWTVDGTLDAATTVKGQIPSADIINPFQPVASGGSLGSVGSSGTSQTNGQSLNGDYRSVTLGATYRATLWSWNGRVEYRTADVSNRWGVISNLLRTLGQGKTIASGLNIYQIRDKTGQTVTFASADLALALRPLDSRWSLLDRFELRHEQADAGVSSSNTLAVPTFAGNGQATFRAINNLAINYRTGPEGAGHGFEASLYYGAKFVRGRYADEVYSGFIDVIGVELRKDIGRHFDVGVNASMQHAWSSHTKSFSAGPSIGVSPAENTWISAGYNVAGFRDRDFEEAHYTRKGAYVTMRLKFDQLSVANVARRMGVSR